MIYDYVKGLFDEKRPVRVWSALALIGVLLFVSYRVGWERGYSEPRFDIPEEWLPAFSGFSSETGERHFFLCDIGMRSLTDLSVTRVATIGPEGGALVELNPLSPDEQRAVQARLERSCAIIDRYRR